MHPPRFPGRALRLWVALWAFVLAAPQNVRFGLPVDGRSDRADRSAHPRRHAARNDGRTGRGNPLRRRDLDSGVQCRRCGTADAVGHLDAVLHRLDHEDRHGRSRHATRRNAGKRRSSCTDRHVSRGSCGSVGRCHVAPPSDAHVGHLFLREPALRHRVWALASDMLAGFIAAAEPHFFALLGMADAGYWVDERRPNLGDWPRVPRGREGGLYGPL